MAETSIEWTDRTWNPLAGCTAKSPGCLNCYAARMAGRLELMGQDKYVGTTVKKGGRRVFSGRINLDEQALLEPIRRKKPTTYFVNSMSDLFWGDADDLATAKRLGVKDPQPVPFEFIDKVFAVMALCPQHTFQILTKRPERMLEYHKTSDRIQKLDVALLEMVGISDRSCRCFKQGPNKPDNWPLKNVWLGTSVENQKEADHRIPLLLNVPAAIRFLSVEPLLGSVNLEWVGISDHYNYTRWNALTAEAFAVAGAGTAAKTSWDSIQPIGSWPIDWVIVGGESGPKARPMHPAWVRSIRDQCIAAGVPFLFKQWGAFADLSDEADGSDLHRLSTASEIFTASGEVLGAGGRVGKQTHGMVDPELKSKGGAWMGLVGKKKAGRILDGRTWDEFPKVTK